MITSSTTVEAGAHLTADLVIVGAGASGITIARRLAGSRLRVIVLEGGGREPDEASQSLYDGVLAGQPTDPLDASRLRFFGGSTNHWGGWCRPLDAANFEKRADWPESGWPIKRADLDPWYAAAAELCQLGPVAFDDLGFWRRQKGGGGLAALPLDGRLLRTVLYQASMIQFAPAHGPALAAADNVRVLLDANAMELLPAPASHAGAGRKAIGGVVVRRAQGGTFTVSGRAYVAALGGIETARLLLLSDKVHPAGAGNENDLVGRYFLDHPLMPNACYVRLAHDGYQAPLYFNIPTNGVRTPLAGGYVFGALDSAPGLSAREKIGDFRFILNSSRASQAGADALREIGGELKHGRLPKNLGEDLANIFADIDLLANNGYKTVTGSKQGFLKPEDEGPFKGMLCDLSFEQRPNRDSRVMLDKSRDAFGQRRVRLDWRFGETERRTAARAIDILAREFGRTGIGRARIRLDLADGKPWPGELHGSCHHSGTARMSDSPAHGVVDADCRVHSVDNLYVAGSAVFPTQGNVNPTLTIVALAARLADHLKQVLA